VSGLASADSSGAAPLTPPGTASQGAIGDPLTGAALAFAAPVRGEHLAHRLRRWAGIFAAYFTAQTATQLLGIAAGILFIRTMPLGEFALYTLATSAITFFTFLTDLGSTGSLVHFYRRAARAGESFAPYVAAVLSLRRRAFLVGAAAVLLALPAAALAKGFGARDAGLATGAVVLAVALQIGASVRLLTLRLHDRYPQSYRAEVAGAGLRLALAFAMVGAAVLRSWLAVLVAAAGSALTFWLARGPGEAAAAGREERARLAPYRRAVIRFLLPTLPSALYFAVQAPLVVWLAATFGASRNIAEVGALSRLGLVVGIFGGLTGVVFLPRLARLGCEREWRTRALQFGAVHLLVAVSLLAAALLAPQPLLWILGESYAGLHRELALVVSGAGLALLDGYLVALNLARSWTRWQGLAVGSLIAAQATLVALLPMGTTTGVLTFNVASAGAALLGQLAILTIGLTRPQWVTWAAEPHTSGDEPLPMP
jgi:O-antigen/teichoic acid export membrane protein